MYKRLARPINAGIAKALGIHWTRLERGSGGFCFFYRSHQTGGDALLRHVGQSRDDSLLNLSILTIAIAVFQHSSARTSFGQGRRTDFH